MRQIPRRGLLQLIGGGGLMGLMTPRQAAAEQAAAQATRAMPAPIIRDITAIETAPANLRLTVVKVTTDQDGLYGYGCGTFTQRADLIKPAVERYLKPLLVGKTTDRIEDIWHTMYYSSYWKNSGVLNNAISGVDQALWDIKGRQAGMPVYQLLGGKCREAVDVYRHASGAEIPQVIASAKNFISQGVRHVRVQVGVPGMAGYGGGAGNVPQMTGLRPGPVFEPAYYIRRTMDLFEACRAELGWEIEILHDVHERVSPNQGVQFCKDAEKFKLFFVEDPLSPEDLAYFRLIRQQCATPIAMGELFNSPHEWQPLIAERLIDYIRIHISQIGGLSPARKVAALAEAFGVKTAWHGPGDVSPIGHMCNVMLGVATHNFGVNEAVTFNERTQEIFQGCPEIRNGYLYPSDLPGWGIEVNEQLAAKLPFGNETGERGRLNGGWGEVRRRDGTVIKQ